MQVWSVLHAARWKYRTQKAKNSPSRHHRTTLSSYIFAAKAHIDNWKTSLNRNISSICPHNMVNIGLLAAEIGSGVWGTPGNFKLFRVLAALLHGTLVVGVSETLWRWAGRPSRWALAQFLVELRFHSHSTQIHCVPENCHYFVSLQLWQTWIDFNNFWHKYCSESRQSQSTLFSHVS